MVSRDGFSLYYRTSGAGKPIIFLAGGPGLEVDYVIPSAELFPAGYQRLFLEERGTGRSRPAKLTAENISLRLMVDDLEALRAHLKLDRFILAGHSWGGLLAMSYASAHPEKIERLILIDSAWLPTKESAQWFSDNIEARLRPEDLETLRHLADAARQGMDQDKLPLEVFRAMLPGYFFDRAKGLAFAAQLPDGTSHRDASALLSADPNRNVDIRDGLRRVTGPVLIIQGHQDPVGDKAAEDIHAALPTSALRYIDRCGHFPWLEQPEKMKAILAEFLSGN